MPAKKKLIPSSPRTPSKSSSKNSPRGSPSKKAKKASSTPSSQSKDVGDDPEFVSRITLVTAALRKESYKVDPGEVGLLCKAAPLALKVPLDKRHPYEDEVVSAVEDIFFAQEDLAKQRQQQVLEAAVKTQEKVSAAAESEARSKEKLAKASLSVESAQEAETRALEDLQEAHRPYERAKRAERVLENARKAAEFVRDRPRRSTGSSPEQNLRAQNLAEQKFKEMQEREEKKREEDLKRGGLSVEELEQNYEAAVEARSSAKQSLKDASRNWHLAFEAHEKAKATAKALSHEKETVRSQYFEAQKDLKVFYQELSAFRYLQGRNVGCGFEPPKDWTPEVLAKLPKLLGD